MDAGCIRRSPPAPLNREVVGWSPKPRMTADTVTDAPTGSRCGGSDNERIAGERLAARAAMKAMSPPEAAALDFGSRIASAVRAGRARSPEWEKTGSMSSAAWKTKDRGKVGRLGSALRHCAFAEELDALVEAVQPGQLRFELTDPGASPVRSPGAFRGAPSQCLIQAIRHAFQALA